MNRSTIISSTLCRVRRCITATHPPLALIPLFLTLLPFFFASCTSDGLPAEPSTPAADSISADSTGTFELTFTAATRAATEAPATRATTTVITKEEADNFLVTVLKGSDTIRTATRLRDLNTSLSAGYGYRVMAENCTTTEAVTVNDGWGQKRFAGTSAAFAIRAGQTTAVNVGCSVANAAIEVVFDQSLAEYFTTSYDVTIRDGNRTIVFNAATAGHKEGDVVTPGRTAYFNLDADGTHQVAYTITAVGPKTLVKEGQLDLSKAKIERINLNYERSNFDFNITLDEEEVFVTEVINITDDDISSDDGITEFNATHEAFVADAATSRINAPASRAVMADDNTGITWETDDAVAVYDFRSMRHVFTASNISGDKAKFSGNVTEKSPLFAAIYPYSTSAKEAASLSTLAATLPTTQYAVAGNIASALNISVAKGERHLDGSPDNVTFYNATQLMRFSVPPYAENKISSIRLTANTAIAGTMDIDYSGDRPVTTIGAAQSKTITILPPRRVNTFEAGTYYIAAAPVRLDDFTLTYACEGKTYTQNSTTAVGGSPSHIYDLGSIDLISTPTATATHVYADNVLQGTVVQVKGEPIEGQQWTADIKNANGTTVRTISGTGDLTSDHTDASWPFLPRGTYTVSYTFTDSNGDTRTKSVALNVPAPTLTLTVDGYSAHTKYEAGDAYAANACDRLTFYAPSARLSVANTLMTNANYTRTFTRSCNGQSTTTTETTNAPSWASYTNVPVSGSLYTFAVTANFAGESVTKSKQFRITGLPANFTPPTKATGWSNDKGTTDFNGDHVRLGNYSWSQPHRIKNDSWFNIPAGTRMLLDYDIVLHSAAVSTTANVKAGDQQIVECTNTKYGKDVHNTGVQQFTANTNVTKVTCEGSYGSGATHTKVYKLFFQYAQ